MCLLSRCGKPHVDLNHFVQIDYPVNFKTHVRTEEASKNDDFNKKYNPETPTHKPYYTVC